MHKYLLVVIILLAALLRFPLLDKYPNGFTPDEASFGYDAYSILNTGRDQWGRYFPLVLESFGDFKAPLYSYLLIPFVAIFGLEVWVVRLPNALFGVLAVIVVYFLIKEIRLKHLHNSTLKKFNLEIVSSFLLAVSPWHVQLSRGAFEANLTAFFMPFGMFLFLKGLKNYKYLLLSGLAFGLNLFTYHAARFVTPIVFAFLILIFLKEIKRINIKYFVGFLVIFLFFVFIALLTLLQGGARRAQDVSIFRGALEAQAEARLKSIQSGLDPFWAKIMNNKYLIVFDRFKDNYLKYFSKEFLVFKGPGEATYGMTPGIPVVYLIEVIALIFFAISTFLSKNKILLFIFMSLIVSIIPASLTMGVGYAGNRAATMLPFVHIASGFGFFYLVYLFNKIFRYKYFVNVLVFIFVFSVFYQLNLFFQDYLNSQNGLVAKSMLYGRLELVRYINENFPNEKLVVSRRLSEPHIFFAFVNKTNPLLYQKNTKDWARYREEGLTFLDQMYKYSLGRYTFKAIEESDFEDLTANEVLVVMPDEIFDDNLIYKSINYPTGEPAFFIVKKQNEEII